MPDNETYTVDLRANTRNYDQGMQTSASATDALTASLGRLGAGLTGLYQRADRKLTIIAAGEAATITGVTVAAGRLDQQMSQLQARQVMLGRQTDAYTGTITNLRRGMGLTSTDAIGLVTQLNRLNVPMSQQQKTVETYVKLSAVTGENVQALTQSNTMFMRQMGNTQPVERYASSLAKLSNDYGASAQGTVDFANQIAPLSKTMGMTSTQILGISAAFSKAGQDGSQAGNVYTKILSDVNRAAQYGSPELQVYSDLIGTSVDQLKSMPKAEVVTEIFEALNKQGPQAIKTLERLGLDGVRSQKAIASVLQQGGLREGIAAADEGFNNAGVKKFNDSSAQALKGLNDQMARSSETGKAFAQSVGGIFLPAADSLAKGFNDILAPVRGVTDFFNGLPGWAKDIGVFGAAIGVLVPLLPKLALGLAGTSLLPMLTRGSLAQGLRMGANPNGAVSPAQRTYMEGGGTLGSRALFRGGLIAGQYGNMSGKRGDLDQHEFRTPDGDVQQIRSMSGYAREAAIKYGLLDPSAERVSTGSMVGNGVKKTSGLVGDLVRSQLTPWTAGYQRNSVLDSETNPQSMTKVGGFRANLAAAAAPLLSRGGYDDNIAAMKDHAKRVRTAAAEFGRASDDQISGLKKNTTALGSIMREVGKTVAYTGQAGVGAVYGGGRLAARGVAAGVMGVGGSLVNGLGGPVALGLGAAVAGAEMYSSNRAGRKAGYEGSEEDNSAGSDYRDALGIASKATTNFASVLQQNAASVSTAVTTVAEAVKVTAIDVQKAAGRTDQIVDDKIKSMNAQQATQYAGAVLGGADPREAEALKYDLVAKFGGTQAQDILNKGQAGAGDLSGMFSMIDGSKQQFGPKWLGANSNWKVTDGTLAQVNTVADTAKNQLDTVSKREGVGGAAKYQQSLINSFLDDSTDYLKKNGSPEQNKIGGVGSSQAINAKYMALAQTLGINEDDSASREALGGVLKRSVTQTQGMSPEERTAFTQDLLTQGLQNTDIGSKLAQARTLGGTYAGTSYTSNAPQADPFAAISGQLNQLRLTQAGRIATNFGQGNSGGTFATAINNEGNADDQTIAVNDFVSKVAATSGNWDEVNRKLVEFKNSAGAASGQVSQLADAALAAAASERNYANQMEGRTKTTDTMAQANSDYATAKSTYNANPEAPGAYQRVDDAKKAQQSANVSATQRLNTIAQQYRQLDISRSQGEVELDRSQSRALEDYYRQANDSEQDYARSRERNVYSFNLSQSRAQEDFSQQRERSEADFRKSKLRSEADYNHSVVLMAQQAARQIYDTYNRVTVQRTWDGANLLQNMADQQKRMAEQQANLAQVRKAGLSNAAIQMLGLNEAGNAQQLQRLVEDMASDPKLIAQFNKAVGKRTKSSTALMKDPANSQWTEMERSRRIQLKRSEEDFSEAEDRQAADFRKSLSRGRKDFNTQMAQSAEDYGIMMSRQRRNLYIGFENMRKDFQHSMNVQAKNISTFAQETGMSFSDAFDKIYNRTTGETHKQIGLMRDLYNSYIGITVDKNNDLGSEINKPYASLALTKPFGDKPKVIGNTRIPGMAEGGPIPFTPTAVKGRDSVLINAMPDEHLWTAKETEAVGGHAAMKALRNAALEGKLKGQDADPESRAKNWGLGAAGGAGASGGGSSSTVTGVGSTAFIKDALRHVGESYAVGYCLRFITNLAGSHIKPGIHDAYQAWQQTGPKHSGPPPAGVPVYWAGGSHGYGHIAASVGGGKIVSTDMPTTGKIGLNPWNAPHTKWGQRYLGWTGSVSGDSSYTYNDSDIGGGDASVPAAATQPDWAKMKSVIAWNKNMDNLGFFDRKNSAQAVSLPNMLANDFAVKAMKKFGSDAFTSSNNGGDYTGSVSTGGAKGMRAIWNALRSGGLTSVQAAGVMGNMQAESSFNPFIRQNGGTSMDPATAGGGGYGLVQWTPGRKLIPLLHGKKPSIASEVNALMEQLHGAEHAAGRSLFGAKSVAEAARVFHLEYERSASKDSSGRIRNAQGIYNRFGGGKTPQMARGGMTQEGPTLVGEEGAELIYAPQGARIKNSTQTLHAIMQSKASQVVPTQGSSQVTNNTYDQSVTYENVEVKATDTRTLERELAYKARLANLTGRGKK